VRECIRTAAAEEEEAEEEEAHLAAVQEIVANALATRSRVCCVDPGCGWPPSGVGDAPPPTRPGGGDGSNAAADGPQVGVPFLSSCVWFLATRRRGFAGRGRGRGRVRVKIMELIARRTG
jgi:hypothetical protein